MAHSSSNTFLSLDRWAQIMGLNPVAFNGACMGNLCFRSCSKCRELWVQSAWQSSGGFMARDDLARIILEAERDIENFLGVPLCPKQRCKTLPYLKDCFPRGWASRWPDLLSGGFYYSSYSTGRPAYELGDCPLFILPRMNERMLGVASREDDTITVLDEEGDPYDGGDLHCPLTVLITVRVERSDPDPNPLQPCQILVRYFGSEEEIKQPREVGIVYDEETNEDIVTILFDSWKLIEPGLWNFSGPYPAALDNSCLNEGINLLDPDTFIDHLEIWQRFHDDSLPQVEFVWESKGNCGCGLDECLICNPAIRSGCAFHRHGSFVVAAPARWDEDKQSWCSDADFWSCRTGPDLVRFHYWTGYLPKNQCPPESLCGLECSDLEYIVATLAASRMNKNLCVCTCNQAYWWQELQTDIARTSRDTGSFFNTVQVINNPFGTRLGEVQTFRKLEMIKHELCGGYTTFTAI